MSRGWSGPVLVADATPAVHSPLAASLLALRAACSVGARMMVLTNAEVSGRLRAALHALHAGGWS